MTRIIDAQTWGAQPRRIFWGFGKVPEWRRALHLVRSLLSSEIPFRGFGKEPNHPGVGNRFGLSTDWKLVVSSGLLDVCANYVCHACHL